MINRTIEQIIYYGQVKLGLGELDSVYVRNVLLHLLDGGVPFAGDIDKKAIDKMDVPDKLIDELSDDLKSRNLDEQQLSSLISQVMSAISPRPQAVADHFHALQIQNPDLATEYLYDISVKNYYVQKSKVDKNILWMSKDGLEISINLSKPEKDNKDIRKNFGSIDTGYPKCVLCYENLGYAGREKFPARENIRIAPLKLGEEEWFLQFSPYGYYNRHCIVIKKEHVPMHITPENIAHLFDFIDQFPHFFIGSNSDLPITGGSILNHEHFQGGAHDMPLMKRSVRTYYDCPMYPDVKVGRLDWYNTCILLESSNRKSLISLGSKIAQQWDGFDDESVQILSHSDNERHNSITPILKKDGDKYRFYILLRNNCVSNEYPGGIFHAHPEFHHIKKEGIGLIEAMGLFILPARLNRQLKIVAEIIENDVEKRVYLKANPDLVDFVDMIESLKEKEGNPSDNVRLYVDDVCKNILINTGVFKDDEKGCASFARFVARIGFNER